MPVKTYSQDLYKILQVDPKAEPEVIAAAYRSLARHYHPDTNRSPEALERMKEINGAYEILGNPDERAEYDRWRAETAPKTSPAPSAAPSSPPPPPRAEERPRPQETRYTPPPPSREEVARQVFQELVRRKEVCLGCGTVTPSKEVQFDWNIGMLLMRRHGYISSLLCRDCIEKYFWEATGKNLFFGWWGVISMWATLFFLIKNLFIYLGALGLKYEYGGVWKQAMGWMVSILAAISLLLYLNSNAAARSVSTAQYLPTAAVPAVQAVYPGTPQPKNFPASTQNPLMLYDTTATYQAKTRQAAAGLPAGCLPAAQISLAQVGQTLCVYGTVLHTYDRPAANMIAYYMVFSRNNDDFYMIVYDAYFKGVEGSCVKATGKIDRLGNAPVMVVPDKLYKCN